MLGAKMLSVVTVLLTLGFSLAVLVSEEAANGNCFIMFAEPLAEPPFPEDGVARMRKHFLANLNINGTGGVLAARGEVPAQHDCCPGGYSYDWVRDGAISMAILQDLVGTDIATMGGEAFVTDAVVHTILAAYAGRVEELQQLAQSSKDAGSPIDVFGEPKWDLQSGRPYKNIWCRPQTDGPGLRAKALMMFASGGLAKVDLMKKLWELIKFDLDWLASGAAFNQTTCDLWEETRGHDFLWNRLTMRQALLMGEPMARAMGDTKRAQEYRVAANVVIGNPLETHLKSIGNNRFITECSTEASGGDCQNYGKDIDGGVILAMIHSGWEKGFGTMAVDVVVAETVQAFNLGFCSIFPVNREDSSIGVPGVLYGRYALDKYGGGNPWHITTAALATLFYHGAEVLARGTTLTVEQLMAWRAAVGSQHFRGTAKEFVAAGDSVMARLRHHIHKGDDWHIFEQFDKYSGKQYNARDFTWSYAEVFASLNARASAMNLIEHPVVLHGPSFARPGAQREGHETCFLTLSEPLGRLPIDKGRIAKMRKHFLANMNVNGLGASMAAPGAVSPAAGTGGNYKYDSVQVGALSMMLLHHLSKSYVGFVGEDHQITPDVAQELMANYVAWVRRIQRTIRLAKNTEESSSAMHDEPEWDIATALPYTSKHCGTQSSVPGLRAQALMLIAPWYASSNGGDVWDLVAFELDWLVNRSVLETETCDVWGETTGKNFLWNDVASVFALMEGHQFALDHGDDLRAQTYKRVAESAIGDPVSEHLLLDADIGGVILSDCVVQQGKRACQKKGQEVSGAVLFSLIHSRRVEWRGASSTNTALAIGSPLITPVAAVIARTIDKLNRVFCQDFEVNSQDTEAGLSGILYGRYTNDDNLGGNPWLVTTAALASLLYQAASFISEGNALDPQEILAWRSALGESFGGTATDFVAAGDSVLLRLNNHIDKDGHLYEQFDRKTGSQFNAKDLTWSYVEVLMALQHRMSALEGLGKFEWEAPDPTRWLRVSLWCGCIFLLVVGGVAAFLWLKNHKPEAWSLLRVAPGQEGDLSPGNSPARALSTTPTRSKDSKVVAPRSPLSAEWSPASGGAARDMTAAPC